MQMDDDTRKAFDAIVKRVRSKSKRLFLHNLYLCNLSRTKAAAMTGVARRTQQYWREKDPVFREAFESIEDLWRAGLESCAVDLAESGSERLVCQLLKAKLPNEYADPQPTINVNNQQVLHPERTQEERNARTLEVMRAIGIAVDTDDDDDDDGTPTPNVLPRSG